MEFTEFTPDKGPEKNQIFKGFVELAKLNVLEKEQLQKQKQEQKLDDVEIQESNSIRSSISSKSSSSSSSDTEDLERTKTKARRMDSNGKLMSSKYMNNSIEGDTFDMAIAEVLGDFNPQAKKNQVIIIPEKPTKKKVNRQNT